MIRVAIIEDVTEIREGLRALIGGTAGFQVSGTYPSMAPALRWSEQDVPDVLLLDLGLPGISGIEGARLLKERFPELRILVLTIYEEDERIFDAICAGACGYLSKKTPPAKLLEGIQEVMAGGSPMSPEVARRLLESVRAHHRPRPVRIELTPHEARFLKLLVKGHSYKTAAAEVGVSVNTASFHVRKIYEKLQVHSKAEAAAKAVREHLA